MSVIIVDNNNTGPPNLTTIHECDATASMTGDWASVNTDMEREETGCLGLKCDTSSIGGYCSLGSVDMRGQRVWMWGRVNHAIDTVANGGFAIHVQDLVTDGRRYHVGGSDNMGFQVLAWSCLVLDFDNYPTIYTDTPGDEPANYAIAQVGLYVKCTAKGYGTADNSFTDIWRYGTGYMITGGGSGTDGTFAEIATEDVKTSDGYAWGITRELQTNVYGVQGQLGFGASGTDDSYFKDAVGSVVVFEDHGLGSGAYKLALYGSTGTNAFILGEKPAGDGINGVTFLSASDVSRCLFDFTDSNFDFVKLYGCTWQNCGEIKFPAYDANKEEITCTFTKCDRVSANTATMQNCTFISASGTLAAAGGALLMPSGHNISDCTFINNVNAIEINTSGTYTFDNLTFSGNTVDINNTSGGAVIVNATNGSNPSTYSGDVTINNAVDVIVHVEDASKTNIENASVYIEEYGNPDNVLMNELTNADGDAEETFNYTGDTAISIRVRKSSSGSTRYYPVNTTGTITSTGFNLNVVLQRDTVASA